MVHGSWGDLRKLYLMAVSLCGEPRVQQSSLGMLILIGFLFYSVSQMKPRIGFCGVFVCCVHIHEMGPVCLRMHVECIDACMQSPDDSLR